MPFGAQQRQIDDQKVERRDGHHAGSNTAGNPRIRSRLPTGMRSRASLVCVCLRAGRISTTTIDARHRGAERNGEQESGRRYRGRAAEPSDQKRSEPLADRGGDHVVAEHVLAIARAVRPHRQHLVPGHAEHVAEAEQDREPQQVHRRARPQPEADAGEQDQRRADPAGLGVVAAVDPTAERRAVKTGMMAKPAAMMPSQSTGRPSSMPDRRS